MTCLPYSAPGLRQHTALGKTVNREPGKKQSPPFRSRFPPSPACIGRRETLVPPRLRSKKERGRGSCYIGLERRRSRSLGRKWKKRGIKWAKDSPSITPVSQGHVVEKAQSPCIWGIVCFHSFAPSLIILLFLPPPFRTLYFVGSSLIL